MDKTAIFIILLLVVIVIGIVVAFRAYEASEYRDRVCRGAGFDGSTRYPNHETINGISYVKCRKTVLETLEPMLPTVSFEKWVKDVGK